jgi:hypothetical protein
VSDVPKGEQLTINDLRPADRKRALVDVPETSCLTAGEDGRSQRALLVHFRTFNFTSRWRSHTTAIGCGSRSGATGPRV